MEVGEWTMQQKRSTMYFVAIPYKMTGQLVLFICQSHFIYCIWQLVSINFGPWDSGALTILGHRENAEIHTGIKRTSVWLSTNPVYLFVKSFTSLLLFVNMPSFDTALLILPFSIFPSKACLDFILPQCVYSGDSNWTWFYNALLLR